MNECSECGSELECRCETFMNKINKIITYIRELHLNHKDGCKGSCWIQEVGYFSEEDGESYWFCKFGGYCFGNLPRHAVTKGNSLDELFENVKKEIHESIEEFLINYKGGT